MALTVEDLYRQYAGREADPGGLAFWQAGFGDTIDAAEAASFQQAVAEARAQGSEPEPVAPAYFNANPDVAAAYAVNSYNLTPEQYAEAHYVNHGVNEGRSAPPPAPVYEPPAPVYQAPAPVYEPPVPVQAVSDSQADALVRAAYAQIGRTGVGGAVSQIDPAGYENFANLLKSGAVRPEDFNTVFQDAATRYMADRPDDPYTQYVTQYRAGTTTSTASGGAETQQAGSTPDAQAQAMTTATKAQYDQLVRDAYAGIGRTGFGTGTNQIDQAGYDAFYNALETGAIAPQDFGVKFQDAVKQYLIDHPTDPYSTYVAGHLVANKKEDYVAGPTSTQVVTAIDKWITDNPGATQEQLAKAVESGMGMTDTVKLALAAKWGVTPDQAVATYTKALDPYAGVQIVDGDGTSFDAKQLMTLAGQVAKNLDASKSAGGAFGTSKTNMGFAYDVLSSTYGNKDFTAADQVAFDMARNLLKQGVTDYSQVGTVPQYTPVQEIKTYNGSRVYTDENGTQFAYVNTGQIYDDGTEIINRVDVPSDQLQIQYIVPGDENTDNILVDPSKVITQNGRLMGQTGTTTGNTTTGQVVNLEFGNTTAGKGNTSYRIDPATGKVYTTAHSSSDVSPGMMLAISIGASLLIPGVGEIIAAEFGSMGIAMTAAQGSAIASAGLQLAMGADPTTVLLTAGLNLGGITGSINSAATDLLSGTVSPSMLSMAADAVTRAGTTMLVTGDATTALTAAAGSVINNIVTDYTGSTALGAGAAAYAQTGDLTTAATVALNAAAYNAGATNKDSIVQVLTGSNNNTINNTVASELTTSGVDSDELSTYLGEAATNITNMMNQPGTQVAGLPGGTISDAGSGSTKLDVSGAATGTAEAPQYVTNTELRTPGTELATLAQIDSGEARLNTAANAWEINAPYAGSLDAGPGAYPYTPGISLPATVPTDAVPPGAFVPTDLGAYPPLNVAPGALPDWYTGANIPGNMNSITTTGGGIAGTPGGVFTPGGVLTPGGSGIPGGAITPGGVLTGGGSGTPGGSSTDLGNITVTGPRPVTPSGPVTDLGDVTITDTRPVVPSSPVTDLGDVTITDTRPYTPPPLDNTVVNVIADTPPDVYTPPPVDNTVVNVDTTPLVPIDVLNTPAVTPGVTIPPTTIASPVNPIRLTSGGLNPGWIAPDDFYSTTSPVQSQFYWGQHPYQQGETFNSALYNTVPNAPVVPYGIQQIAGVNPTARRTNSASLYQKPAPGAMAPVGVQVAGTKYAPIQPYMVNPVIPA